MIFVLYLPKSKIITTICTCKKRDLLLLLFAVLHSMAIRCCKHLFYSSCRATFLPFLKSQQKLPNIPKYCLALLLTLQSVFCLQRSGVHKYQICTPGQCWSWSICDKGCWVNTNTWMKPLWLGRVRGLVIRDRSISPPT